MQEFFGWFHKQQGTSAATSAWLILGKGPSYSSLNENTPYKINALPVKVLGLNDVVRDKKVDIAHCIDFDVVLRNGDAIARNAGVLVMPWHPHISHKATPKTLEDLLSEHEILQQLDQQQRLCWYNLRTSKDQRPDSPTVDVRYFSAEAAINLLAMAGVKTIRTLGIDGGKQYSNQFEDLNGESLLSNGRESFDAQFSEISKSIFRYDLDFGPYDGQTPVKIFVGTLESQMLATRVLEYSIRKHASISVEVTPLHESPIPIPMPAETKNHPRTPFSFQRFLIPQSCGYQGKAIYLDSDMLVFNDIRNLWNHPMANAEIVSCWETTKESGRRPQFSVMMLDCSKLDWEIQDLVERLNSGELTYQKLVYEMAIAKNISATIEPHWNSLEVYRKGITSLLHYTDMQKQPWVRRHNPLAWLWCQELIDAVQQQFISRDELEKHITMGWVRPSLGYQVDHQISHPERLSRRITRLDDNFVAPFESLIPHSPIHPLWRIKKNVIQAIRRLKGIIDA